MIFTIPNLISLVRILTVPYMAWLLIAENPVAAAWVFGALASTDWIDGWLARRLGQVSELGKILDPAADRLAVATAVITGWVTEALPWPIALAVILREVFVAGMALVLATRTRERIEVRYLGKVATSGVYWAIPFFFLFAGTEWAWHGWVAWSLIVPSLVLYYVVAWRYLGDTRRLLAESEPVSSAE